MVVVVPVAVVLVVVVYIVVDQSWRRLTRNMRTMHCFEQPCFLFVGIAAIFSDRFGIHICTYLG